MRVIPGSSAATEKKQTLVDLNQTIGWVPGHIRDGRFGKWLDELKDWSLGRERFWGTPLPIWEDEETGERILIGSVAELSELAGRDLRELDLHRPYVDGDHIPQPQWRRDDAARAGGHRCLVR